MEENIQKLEDRCGTTFPEFPEATKKGLVS